MNVQSREHVANLDMEIATTTLTSDLRRCAILLDIDGTILDIAPTPSEVWVPTAAARDDRTPAGPDRRRAGPGERPPLNDIDLIFAPLQLAAIGGHGAELRPVPGDPAANRATDR